MALFGSRRDFSIIRGMNREVMGDVISQQASFYKHKLGQTKTNMYGEASGEKFFDGPYLFFCLISRQDQSQPTSEAGVNFKWGVDFAFLRDDLVDSMYVPEIGDVVLYQEGYYEINNLNANQYWAGKNPDYPNNENPTNPGLEKFGASVSIVARTHYVPADKYNISPYKERF